MEEKTEKTHVVKCKHNKDGKVCNNIICVRCGEVVTVRKQGREIKACITDFFPVIIACEDCGGVTKLFLEKK